MTFNNSVGETLVLRPDHTIAIARLASSRMNHNQDTYQCYDTIYRKNDHHRETEKYEIGVESIGTNGVSNDCDLLELCINTMTSLGIHNYRIDVNHASFFDAIDKDTLTAMNNRDYTKLKTYPKQGKEDILNNDSPLVTFANEMKKEIYSKRYILMKP